MLASWRKTLRMHILNDILVRAFNLRNNVARPVENTHERISAGARTRAKIPFAFAYVQHKLARTILLKR